MQHFSYCDGRPGAPESAYRRQSARPGLVARTAPALAFERFDFQVSISPLLRFFTIGTTF